MRGRRLCGALLACTAAALLWLAFDPAPADAVEDIRRALILESDAPSPPPATAAWRQTTLPLSRSTPSSQPPKPVWLRLQFDVPRPPGEFWAVLLLYMYGGGQVWLDGHLVGDMPVSDAAMHVRWERPYLVVLPRLSGRGPARTGDPRQPGRRRNKAELSARRASVRCPSCGSSSTAAISGCTPCPN